MSEQEGMSLFGAGKLARRVSVLLREDKSIQLRGGGGNASLASFGVAFEGDEYKITVERKEKVGD